MTGSVMLFLLLRTLHVLLAAAWFGAAAFTTLYLGPTVDELGVAGGKVTDILVRRGIVKYMASIGGLTVLIGFYLFWRLTGDPTFAGSRHGIAISIGALTGVIALILGGSMVGASAKKVSVLARKAASLPEGAERTTLLKTMDGLRARMATFSKIVTALLFISMVLMSLAHFA